MARRGSDSPNAWRTALANAVGLLEAGGVRCHTDLVAYDDVRPDARRLLAAKLNHTDQEED